MQPDNILCIASCGKAKIWNKKPRAGPTKAEGVYIGSYAKNCIQYAKNFYPSSWCILSAKYGFLLPDDIVPADYNVTFNDKNTDYISVERLKRQAVEKNLIRFKKIVIIAGKEYAKIASKVFPDAIIVKPLNGHGGIFKQASILSQAVRRDVPLDEILISNNHNDNKIQRINKSLSRQASSTGLITTSQKAARSNSSYSNDISSTCAWLHRQLEVLPPIRFPFDINHLPLDGIYFFYEKGEVWGHGDSNITNNNDKLRIVRIGTHKDGNFKSRIAEHFLLEESRRMNFTVNTSAPHDRSIFRKNIGRALLAGNNDEYLKVWEIDFTTSKNRNEHGWRRNIEKEKQIEARITEILRKNFLFRFIVLEGQAKRMGTSGLESRLISTVANCKLCKPSNSWLGLKSPKPQIRDGKMWIVQHLKGMPLTAEDKDTILSAIGKTKEFLRTWLLF